MLNPCSPCMGSYRQCEKCIFGYRSREENHKTIKKSIEDALASGEPLEHHRIAWNYMLMHSDWKEQMEDGPREKKEKEGESKNMLQSGILAKCERCGLERFFADGKARGDALDNVLTSGWEKVDDRYTCPDCAVVYWGLMKKFWNKED